jgi:spore coat protein CotH/photosystem II stability/assembly factor-like uncharacterized protein
MKLKNLFLMLFAVSIATAQVREYFFYINPDSLNLLYSRSIWDETYIPMKLVYNGVERSGEIRFKGHTSRRYPKKPFRVKLKKGQELDNYRFLGFNAMYTDKSLMREKIVWDLYKQFGRVTPETYYVNIYINDKNYGLYLFVERIDKTFELMPEKYGFNRGGTMYQPYDGTHCGDLFIPTDTMDYYRCYEKQFPADSNYSDLIQLINQINTTPTENFHTLIDSLFYGDCVTDWLVLNALTSDGDTYNKNYYLYHDSVLNKWLIIPWDYDLTFGRNGDFNLPYPLDLLNDNFTYWYPPNTTGPDNPLKSKFFQNPILRARFNQKLDSLLRYEFTETKLYPYIDSLKNLIKEYVYKDEFKWGTNQEFEEQVEALKYFITARKFYLYKWLSNYWPGEKNRATLRITQTDTVYHFVDKIGQLLASVWLYEAVGLDSLTVEVFPDSTAPALPSHALPDKFVKRFYKITPHPQNARFKLKLRVEYLQEFLSRTEVGSGIADERFLKLHYFDGYSWRELDTKVNAYANTLTVDSLTEKEITGTILCAFLPQEYKQTWNKVDFKTWNKLHKVRFFDDKIGYIVGETSSIYMTTDGGNSWRLFSMGKQIPFKDVAFSDSSVFVVGDQGLLYKSKVGDTLWVQIPFVKSNLKKIEFFNRSKYGFILTADSGVYFTRDAGNSWERPGVHWGNDIAMSDTDKFIIAVRGGILTYYEDMLIFIDSVNFDLIRRESTSGKILLSGDGKVYFGYLTYLNWVKSDLGVRIKDVKFLDSSRIFLAGESGRIFYSKDGGKTWHLQPIGSTLDIYSIDFIDSLQGWATGISGLVLSTKSGGITLIQEDKSNIPEKFVLHQNYPNPFNSATVISFEIPNPGWVAIEIYDVLGRKVKTLYSGHTEPGHYQVHFDAKDIASGVYFYVLRAEKTLIAKKMVLIK